jgi:hypothetical protein
MGSRSKALKRKRKKERKVSMKSSPITSFFNSIKENNTMPKKKNQKPPSPPKKHTMDKDNDVIPKTVVAKSTTMMSIQKRKKKVNTNSNQIRKRIKTKVVTDGDSGSDSFGLVYTSNSESEEIDIPEEECNVFPPKNEIKLKKKGSLEDNTPTRISKKRKKPDVNDDDREVLDLVDSTGVRTNKKSKIKPPSSKITYDGLTDSDIEEIQISNNDSTNHSQSEARPAGTTEAESLLKSKKTNSTSSFKIQRTTIPKNKLNLTKSIKCNCKNGCKKACGCRKKGSKCTNSCYCRGTCNNAY